MLRNLVGKTSLRQVKPRAGLIQVRRQSQLGGVEVLDQEQSDDLNVLRQRKFNDAIVENLRTLKRTPKEEFGDVDEVLNKPLTSKEKQLDEELTDFLKRYAVTNKILKDSEETQLNNNVLSNKQSSFPFMVQSAADKPYTSQELFLRQMKHAKGMGKAGAEIKNIYYPHKDINYPVTPEKLSIEKLLEAGVHLGQSTSLWRASTQSFVYGEYKGIHIIDLNQTLSHLKRACKVVEGIAENGGTILFLGTRDGQKKALESAARRAHGYYVSSRWIPGTLTNPTEISSGWERLEVDMLDNPTGRELTPDEQSSIVKPDLLIVLNPTENRIALKEAMQARVPTIGIIDTDSEPSFVTYPIPGNDDSTRSINLLLGVMAKAAERGYKNRLRDAANK